VSLKLDLEAPLDLKRSTSRSTAGRQNLGTLRGRSAAGASWWTARATAGEVRAGFSKEEILKKPEADPRAEGGIFARLGGLLQTLAD
jgi:hypothetical protein